MKGKGYNQENFSYLVFKKGKREKKCKYFLLTTSTYELLIFVTLTASVARLLQPVKKRTRHIICNLCTPEGTYIHHMTTS